MFGKKRQRVSVSKDDIKKAVKRANERLESTNKRIKSTIEDKKESLQALEVNIDIGNKELDLLLASVVSAKGDAVEAKEDSKKERARLLKLKKSVDKAVADKDLIEGGLTVLTEESDVLNKNIAKMNKDLAIASALKEEIEIFKSDKKSEAEELKKTISEANDIKKELSKLRTESIKKKEEHKELIAGLDAETEVKQKSLDTVDGEYTIKIAELNTKLSLLTDNVNDKEDDLKVMQSLVTNAESEYIQTESKRKQAENELLYAKDLLEKDKERVAKEIEEMKNGAKNWKVSFLEEIARMKMKKKIANIDTAGLSDILNG